MGDSSSNRPNTEEISRMGSPSMEKKKEIALVQDFCTPNEEISISREGLSVFSESLVCSMEIDGVLQSVPVYCLLVLLLIYDIAQTKDSQLVDSLSKGWTDEKHTLFLNSIESSFVNELHNGEYNSKAFPGWISRTNVHKGSRRPYETDLKPDQFKVMRKGCWENLVYDRDKKNAQIEVDSLPLSANPWIKHFRSPWIMSEKNLKSSDRIDDSEFIRPSLHVASEGHYGEGTSIKQNYCQNLDGNSAEVSDQNFLDDMLISRKKSSIIGRKRQLRAAVVHDSINDQLIPSWKPSLMPTSDGNHTHPRATNSESSSRTSSYSKHIAALSDDEEVNS